MWLNPYLVLFSILATAEATYFPTPPYDFDTIGVGLLNLPAFIGALIGSIWGGPVSDWSFKYFVKRNGGIYELEMRLWLSVFPAVAVAGPAGGCCYGYSVAAASGLPFRGMDSVLTEGMHWIVPCIGAGLFGFSLTAIGDTTLTYLSDSYREIVGDYLVAVAFMRNVFATVVVFALTPWI